MSPPDESRFARLTERETEFLLLYDRQLLIKEIAFRCGVSDATVNKAFESARRKLDTRTTREAARLVAARPGREKSIGQFHTLGGQAELVNLASSDQDREGLPPTDAPTRQEHPGQSVSARSSGVLSVLWGGGESLSPGQRAAAIVLLAFLIVITAGMLVTVGRGFGYTVAAVVRAMR